MESPPRLEKTVEMSSENPWNTRSDPIQRPFSFAGENHGSAVPTPRRRIATFGITSKWNKSPGVIASGIRTVINTIITVNKWLDDLHTPAVIADKPLPFA